MGVFVIQRISGFAEAPSVCFPHSQPFGTQDGLWGERNHFRLKRHRNVAQAGAAESCASNWSCPVENRTHTVFRTEFEQKQNWREVQVRLGMFLLSSQVVKQKEKGSILYSTFDFL